MNIFRRLFTDFFIHFGVFLVVVGLARSLGRAYCCPLAPEAGKVTKTMCPKAARCVLPPLRVTLQDPFWSPKMEQIMENTNPKCLWVTFWEFLENASVRTTFLMDFYGFFNMWKRKKCVKPSEGRSNLRGSFFWAKNVSTSISDCVSVSWGFTLASF